MHNFLNIDKSIIIVSISPLRNLREQTFCLTFGNSYSCFFQLEYSSVWNFGHVESYKCTIKVWVAKYLNDLVSSSLELLQLGQD